MSDGARREKAPVDSPRHPIVALARAVEHDARARARPTLYIAWGLHLVQEALDAGAPIAHALISPACAESPHGTELARRLLAAGTLPLRTTSRILEAIVPGSGDQGIVLLLPRPAHDLAAILERRPTLILAAHGVQDPGNLGSIVRTSLALGSAALVALEGCADPLGSRAVRAAMGAHFRLPVLTRKSGDALGALRAAGLRIVAADPRGGDPPQMIDLTAATALLVGSEGEGLPPAILAAAQERVRIPMRAGVDSMNVHAAAAVLLYETARQRGFPFGGVPQ